MWNENGKTAEKKEKDKNNFYQKFYKLLVDSSGPAI